MLKCMIIEDEPLAMKQIRSYIERTPFLLFEEGVSSAVEAMEILDKIRPDLLFVDINMPEINGIDFVKSLVNPPLIIFTTAYSEYAIDGFRVDAVDYLLKPIGYTDFLKAANKAKKHQDLFEKTLDHGSEDSQYLFFRSDHKFVKVRISNIKYIEGMREYIRIHLIDGPSIMTILPVKTIEGRLPQKQFRRVHRSYIINTEEIVSIQKQRVVLCGNVEILIGNQYKEGFEQFIEDNLLR